MMNIIAWIIFGALTGWIASLIVGTDDQQGPIANIAVGIAGALIGGALVSALGGEGFAGFTLSGLLVALLGSVVLLSVIMFFKRT